MSEKEILQLLKEGEKLVTYRIKPKANLTDTENATSTENTTTVAKKGPVRKATFRQLQEKKVRERRTNFEEREAYKPKLHLGADCESLVCGACKVVVEEFSRVVKRNADDPEKLYVEDLLDPFCSSRELQMKYNDIVPNVCRDIANISHNGHRNFLSKTFQEDVDFNNMDSLEQIFEKQRSICVGVGACGMHHFEFQTEPESMYQEHWDDKCYVCQAFANDLEVIVQLSRGVTEGRAMALAAGTCDRLLLPEDYDHLCR